MNQTQQMAVTGVQTDGTSRDLAGFVSWTSSNTTAATVTAVSGLVTARAVGTATVTATLGTLSASALVTVSALVSDTTFPVAEITAPRRTRR